ncbi:ABC transporter substrate-binding protein [Marinibaculum pumilum]|uniref:ABC transporter substrate-binding protein n=1 Tax=Marinibaculum pumilum TaxID=1766165 RepID=A0ABV7L683_9PROT
MLFGDGPLTKRDMFLVILGVIVLVGTLLSLAVRFTVLEADQDNPYRIAVVGPMSGPAAETGLAMRRGASLAVRQLNRAEGVAGRGIALAAFDDRNDPDLARQRAEEIVADDSIVAVIGHWAPQASAAAAPVYAAAGLPMILPASAPAGLAAELDNVFATVFDKTAQTRFMANYVRNVVGEKTASIIHADSAEGRDLAQTFDKTYQRFGTRVLNMWSYAPSDPILTDRALAIAAEIQEKKILGHVFVQGDPDDTATLLVALRRSGVRNPVVGLADMATTAFARAVALSMPKVDQAPGVTDGVLAATPLLFDTATEVAQAFQTDFIEAHDYSPDWLSAFTFDDFNLVAAMLRRQIARGGLTSEADGAAARSALMRALGGLTRPEDGVKSVGGNRYFGDAGQNTTPVQVGLYNGISLISAMTQLQPILEQGVTGYLDLLKEGKVLYVNDRFMYKTNVVYTGIQLLNVSQMDLDTGLAELEFIIWFRYRGDFAPQDLVFINAVEPVALEEPIRESLDGDIRYAAYRVKGSFKTNFSDVSRPYGSVVIGLAFHHRLLSQNNLMYVSDVLGMGLAGSSTLLEVLQRDSSADTQTGDSLNLTGFAALAQALDPSGSADGLLEGLVGRRVFAPLAQWRPDRAWISQELADVSSEGDPSYVGYGKPEPEFTRIDFGAILVPDEIEVGALVPKNWLFYIAIFSFVASVFAAAMDRRDRGQFWRVQTLCIRIVAWPLLLFSVGSLALEHAYNNWSAAEIDILLMVYLSLWWLVPARLAASAMERFIWVPLEIRSQRKIPNVVRLFAAACIYLFAIFGIVGFVFDQQLTSLLATSGLLTLVIGLAVQANIANVFSGIVLNIERPFKVGDMVQVEDFTGIVTDITWRTTRVCGLDGVQLSVPNGKMSEGEIINLSASGATRDEREVFVPASYDPVQAFEAIRAAEARIREALAATGQQDDVDRFMVHNDGVKVLEFGAFHRFRVTWWMELAKTDYHFIRHSVHQEIWRSLHEQGIEMAFPEHPGADNPPPGRLPPGKPPSAELPSGELPGRPGGMQAYPAE